MGGLLVTGGAGFIGANFVHYWLREHPGQRLVVLDALTYAGDVKNLQVAKSADFRFVHGNICDGVLVEGLLREERLDAIVHFAAESHVDRSIYGPDTFIDTNIGGTHSLLKAARRVWMEECSLDTHRFHHVSTDEVYGSLGVTDRAFDEQTAYAPNSPYSASKAASDHLVRAYFRTYGLRTTTSNCSNNYGPFQFPEKLVPLMIVNALGGRPIPVYGDGCNVRDWLHVSDHCRAVDLILHKGVPGEVYCIGGEAESRNIDMVDILCRIVDEAFEEHPELSATYPECPAARGRRTSSLIKFVRDRPGHDRRYAIDCRKIKRELGYGSRVSLESGLRDTFSWYVQNEWWWRGAKDREDHERDYARMGDLSNDGLKHRTVSPAHSSDERVADGGDSADSMDRTGAAGHSV